MNEQATKEMESGIFYYTEAQAKEKVVTHSISLPAIIRLMFEDSPDKFESKTRITRFYLG